MPLMQGVAENFIGILRTEDRATQRALIRTAVLIGVLVLFAGLLIDLPDGAFFGVGTGIVALAVVVGGGIGILTGRTFTVRRYRDSLASGWNHWMRYSVACQRVDEVHRRVRGKPATRGVGALAVVWSIVLFVTLLLLFMTVVDGMPAVNKTPVFIGYGLYLGWLLGRTLAVKVWVKQFLSSIDELLRAGELGLWGII